jgi:dihydrofolate reductase
MNIIDGAIRRSACVAASRSRPARAPIDLAKFVLKKVKEPARPARYGSQPGGATMKIVVIDHLSLDGVMQSPGGPEEDARGGFKHGGWAQPDNDRFLGEAMGERMSQSGSLLLGRFTYEAFHAYWPKQKDNPYTDVLNRTQKYVASRKLEEPLPWENSTLLRGDAGDAVAKLKQQPGKDIVVLGSGDLIRTLMRRELIDEYVLMIHARVLGSGRRLFDEESPTADLELVECKPTPKGVLLATYRARRSAKT